MHFIQVVAALHYDLMAVYK